MTKYNKEPWWAVIGYRDRVEVMDGEVYHQNPPTGWVWVNAVDKKDAPNEATAVYRATLWNAPADRIAEFIKHFLEDQEWEITEQELEWLEEIDLFLASCGKKSVFAGLSKREIEYGYVELVEEEEGPDERKPEPYNPDQLALEID